MEPVSPQGVMLPAQRLRDRFSELGQDWKGIKLWGSPGRESGKKMG